MKKISLISLFAALFLLLQPSHAQMREVQAISVNDFLNSLGVNSAIDSRGETIDKTIECIKYLGVRWIRSGYENETSMDNYKRLRSEANVRLSYGLLSGGNDIERLISSARKLADIDALLAIEGNNEPNNWGISYQGEEGGRDKSWLAVARLQRDLYTAVKNDPVLKKYPVWSISENGAQTDNVGLQFLTIPDNVETLMPAGTVYADYANCHNYITHPAWSGLHNNQTWLSADPGKNCPVDGLYGNYGITWAKKHQGYSENELIDLPRVTTETGITIEAPISEEVQAKLQLSLYLSQFKRGWKHTAVYLLRDRVDEEGNQSFGFYDRNYNPRLSAHYLHNLTTILSYDDNKGEPNQKLIYSIPDQPDTVHDLLLQAGNGDFRLVVWGERYEGGKDEIRVQLNKKYREIKVFDPTKGIKEAMLLKQTDFIPLTMSDHPYIIELRK